MNVDFTKICRVCMSKGSRDIFIKSFEKDDPLDRLLEKLRYVTMAKIEENDDLPRFICDLCIVQLNVSYNFKQLAIENDTKLRQYFIENGISNSQVNVTLANQVTTNETMISNSRSPVKTSNTSIILPQQQKTMPIIPIVIKEEPNESIKYIKDCSAKLSPSTSITTSTNSVFDKNTMVFLHSYRSNSVTPNYRNVDMFPHNDTNEVGGSSSGTYNFNSQKDADFSNNSLIENSTNNFYQKEVSNTRKQLGKKRVNENLKHKGEIKKLSINMLPPMGKLSRKEMKKNVDYTALFKFKLSSFKSNTTTPKMKKSKVNANGKHNRVIEDVLFNSFNVNPKIKQKLKDKLQNCELQNKNGNVKLIKPKIEPGTKN